MAKNHLDSFSFFLQRKEKKMGTVTLPFNRNYIPLRLLWIQTATSSSFPD
jgi:hypothetical protein